MRTFQPVFSPAPRVVLVSLAWLASGCSRDTNTKPNYIAGNYAGAGAPGGAASGTASGGATNGGTSAVNGGTSAVNGGTSAANGGKGAISASNGGSGGPQGGSGGTAGSAARGPSLGGTGGTEPDAGPPPQCQNQGTATPCSACTHQGPLVGTVASKSCAYLGVPYAKPPTGARRLAAPEPAESWSGTRNANAFGPACVQSGADVSFASSTGEDCLYLNVWTPMAAPSRALPVMVFVHGGAFIGGSTNLYDATVLSEKGPVVVVSMNYRLGAFGFFAHPELDKQRGGEPSGSDGIRDQQLALRWIHDNIAAFHGDPANVTLFGESAGGSSVGVHAVSPGTRGLVSRFILESGVPTRGGGNFIAAAPRDAAYAFANQMASDLCPNASDVIACLRGLPSDKLANWKPSSGTNSPISAIWAPVVDGPGGVLPETPEALLTSGKSNPGPIILGSNKNEWALFALTGGSPSTVADLRTRVKALFPDSVDAIMSLYAPNDFVDASKAFITMMTDTVFRCPTRGFARLASAHGHDVYLYSFEEGTAPHAGELQYVFDYGLLTITLDLTPPTPPLVSAVQSYWTNFARGGDPNGTSLVAWPKYETSSDQHLTLINPPVVASGLQRTACDFWDSYAASH